MAGSAKISISTAAAVAEEESRHLLGVGPAGPGFIDIEKSEARTKLERALAARRASRGWFRRFFVDRFIDDPIRDVCKPLDAHELKRRREQRRRATQLGHFKRLAVDHQLVTECLRHYNSMHPSDEYEPAPGVVTKHIRPAQDGACWTHGNFVARRKRSGCCGLFPLLPAPRTLFFFELLHTTEFRGVVTCTPLLDEPVTEGYSVLGFPIWWGTRRDGRWDCICKTCYRRYDSPQKTLACGHSKAEIVCEMCKRKSTVLHPLPGEFAYGYREYLQRYYYQS